jgi:tRNA (guanine-N7-)-methyltransferase
MGRSKLDKFRDNDLSDYVIQPGKDLFDSIKGKWREAYFHNDNPLVLELACGRGEYTIGLARVFPERNFVGVDIKGPRIWNGMKLAEADNMKNVGFLRGHIQNLEDFFEEGEVDGIWITFPDPRPKGRDERRRLTHDRFLELYRKILKPGGWLCLKTDNEGLYEYSLEVLSNRNDILDLEHTNELYNSPLLRDHHGIKTNYENKYLENGVNIKYLKFKFQD